MVKIEDLDVSLRGGGKMIVPSVKKKKQRGDVVIPKEILDFPNQVTKGLSEINKTLERCCPPSSSKKKKGGPPRKSSKKSSKKSPKKSSKKSPKKKKSSRSQCKPPGSPSRKRKPKKVAVKSSTKATTKAPTKAAEKTTEKTQSVAAAATLVAAEISSEDPSMPTVDEEVQFKLEVDKDPALTTEETDANDRVETALKTPGVLEDLAQKESLSDIVAKNAVYKTWVFNVTQQLSSEESAALLPKTFIICPEEVFEHFEDLKRIFENTTMSPKDKFFLLTRDKPCDDQKIKKSEFILMTQRVLAMLGIRPMDSRKEKKGLRALAKETMQKAQEIWARCPLSWLTSSRILSIASVLYLVAYGATFAGLLAAGPQVLLGTLPAAGLAVTSLGWLVGPGRMLSLATAGVSLVVALAGLGLEIAKSLWDEAKRWATEALKDPKKTFNDWAEERVANGVCQSGCYQKLQGDVSKSLQNQQLMLQNLADLAGQYTIGLGTMLGATAQVRNLVEARIDKQDAQLDRIEQNTVDSFINQGEIAVRLTEVAREEGAKTRGVVSEEGAKTRGVVSEEGAKTRGVVSEEGAKTRGVVSEEGAKTRGVVSEEGAKTRGVVSEEGAKTRGVVSEGLAEASRERKDNLEELSAGLKLILRGIDGQEKTLERLEKAQGKTQQTLEDMMPAMRRAFQESLDESTRAILDDNGALEERLFTRFQAELGQSTGEIISQINARADLSDIEKDRLSQQVEELKDDMVFRMDALPQKIEAAKEEIIKEGQKNGMSPDEIADAVAERADLITRQALGRNDQLWNEKMREILDENFSLRHSAETWNWFTSLLGYEKPPTPDQIKAEAIAAIAKNTEKTVANQIETNKFQGDMAKALVDVADRMKQIEEAQKNLSRKQAEANRPVLEAINKEEPPAVIEANATQANKTIAQNTTEIEREKERNQAELTWIQKQLRERPEQSWWQEFYYSKPDDRRWYIHLQDTALRHLYFNSLQAISDYTGLDDNFALGDGIVDLPEQRIRFPPPAGPSPPLSLGFTPANLSVPSSARIPPTSAPPLSLGSREALTRPLGGFTPANMTPPYAWEGRPQASPKGALAPPPSPPLISKENVTDAGIAAFQKRPAGGGVSDKRPAAEEKLGWFDFKYWSGGESWEDFVARHRKASAEMAKVKKRITEPMAKVKAERWGDGPLPVPMPFTPMVQPVNLIPAYTMTPVGASPVLSLPATSGQRI